jgi:hypothetical protein
MSFRTSRPISIKLGILNYPWVKGIQVSSNKGPGAPVRGIIILKMEWGHLKKKKILKNLRP